MTIMMVGKGVGTKAMICRDSKDNLWRHRMDISTFWVLICFAVVSVTVLAIILWYGTSSEELRRVPYEVITPDAVGLSDI